MLKIVGIDHIVLRTTQRQQMLHFYCEVLGCTVERTLPPELGLTQLRAGNALIDIVDVNSELGQLGGGPPTAKDNNVDHFCLQLHPIDEAEVISHLQRHGITETDFQERYGAQGFGRSLYIHDPEGNVVELRPQANDIRGNNDIDSNHTGL